MAQKAGSRAVATNALRNSGSTRRITCASGEAQSAVKARGTWAYGETGGDLGVTDKFGNVTIRADLAGEELLQTVRHESVHQFFSPEPGLIGNIRAGFGMAAYQHSSLVRYMEEAIAETWATGSLRQGLVFPISEGYVSGGRVIIEGVGYITVVGGTAYGTYQWAKGGRR